MAVQIKSKTITVGAPTVEIIPSGGDTFSSYSDRIVIKRLRTKPNNRMPEINSNLRGERASARSLATSSN
jgi:hypothetical protein